MNSTTHTTFGASQERPRHTNLCCNLRFLWLALLLAAPLASAAPALPNRGFLVEYDSVAQALAQSPSQLTTTYAIKGRNAINDGLAGTFYYYAGDTTATNDTDCFAWGAGRLRRWYEAVTASRLSVTGGSSNYMNKVTISGITIDPRNYPGADPLGAGDSLSAFQSALNAAAESGGTVLVPYGTYAFSDQLSVTGSVSIISLDPRTTLTWAGAANLDTSDDAAFYVHGTTAALPDLSGTHPSGTNVITFAAAHGLSVSDVFFICDTNQYSYSNARTYYYQGDALRVASVDSATQVTTSSRTYGTYTPTGVVVTKQVPARVTISGFNMIGKTSLERPVLLMANCADSIARDLNITGTPDACLRFHNCYETTASNIKAVDRTASVGLNYGIHISNSQRISINSCYLETTRHGLSGGGGDSVTAIPTREVTVNGGTIAGGLFGPNWHGNCDTITVSGASLPNGAFFGANHSQYIGCLIGNDNINGCGIADQGEPTGFDHLVSGNTIVASRDFAGGLIGWYPRASTVIPGGWFKVSGNNITLGPYVGIDGAVDIFPIAGTNNWGFDISGNTIYGTVETNGISVKNTGTNTVTHTPAFPIQRGSIRNNKLYGTGIRANVDIQSIDICDNEIYDAPEYGIQNQAVFAAYTYVNSTWRVNGNRIERPQRAGIKLTPSSGAVTGINENYIIDPVRTVLSVFGAVNSTDANIWVNAGTNLEMNRNHFYNSDTNSYYLYVIDAITSVSRQMNQIDGVVSRTSVTGVTSDRSVANRQVVAGIGDSQFQGATHLLWDETNKGLTIGPTIYGASTVPFYIHETGNAFQKGLIQNDIALGNTSAAAGWAAFSFDSSGTFGAFPSDYNNSSLQDRVGIVADSTAANGVVVSAESAGMRIDLRSPSSGVLSLFNSLMLYSALTLRNATASFSADQDGDVVAATLRLTPITKVQKAALTPAEGMIVMQSDNTPGLRVYQSGAWMMISTVADP